MPVDWFPLTLSLRVAALSTAIARCSWALAIAYGLANFRFRGERLLDAAVTLPWSCLRRCSGTTCWCDRAANAPSGEPYESVTGRPAGLHMAGGGHCSIPSLRPAADQIGAGGAGERRSHYERAARSLGASETRLFFRVTLPLAWRSILAATALCFARSMGDFGATLMVAGNIPGRTQTVAIAIYDAVEVG